MLKVGRLGNFVDIDGEMIVHNSELIPLALALLREAEGVEIEVKPGKDIIPKIHCANANPGDTVIIIRKGKEGK